MGSSNRCLEVEEDRISTSRHSKADNQTRLKDKEVYSFIEIVVLKMFFESDCLASTF